MRKIVISIVAMGLLTIVWGCTKNEPELPSITAVISSSGASGDEQITIKKGESVTYKFTVKSHDAELKKLELWQFNGRGINKVDPSSPIKMWKAPSDELGYQYEVSGTLQNLTNDAQLSVYAEDFNGNYSSRKVSAFLDVMRFNQTLLAANNANSAEAFLNLETGRALPVAMTISDPSAIDVGYAYLSSLPSSGPKANGCLISFDEFWKAGIYAMNNNSLNATTTIRKVTGMTQAIYDNVSYTELNGIFESGIVPVTPSGMGFTPGRIITGLAVGDGLALKTYDGRIGLLWVKAVAAANIQLSVVVQNKTYK